MIERVNRYTGIAYRDDPAVFAWELINEPRCRNCARHLQDWIEEMAKYVKSLDANHLLSTGQEGFYAAGAKGSVDANPELWALTTGQSFVENHDVPEIDFAVAHLWPDNWGVFSLGGSLGDDFSVDWIRAHERDARELLGKPLVLEEFGATGAGVSAVLETRAAAVAAAAETTTRGARRRRGGTRARTPWRRTIDVSTRKSSARTPTDARSPGPCSGRGTTTTSRRSQRASTSTRCSRTTRSSTRCGGTRTRCDERDDP